MSRCTCNDPTHFHPGDESGYWLLPLIDVPKTIALNENQLGSVRSVFKTYEKRLATGDGGPLEADDGELIVVVPFTETVRIKSFQLIPVSEDTIVRSVKLFANREGIDFNNISDIKPLQFIDNIVPDFEGVIDNPLLGSKFSAVDTLIMYITGVADELVQILSLGFRGESRGLNKKVVEGIKYEIRAQLKDHTSTKADNTGNNDVL